MTATGLVEPVKVTAGRLVFDAEEPLPVLAPDEPGLGPGEDRTRAFELPTAVRRLQRYLQ